MDDNFSTLDSTFWSHEVQVGGYGFVPPFCLYSSLYNDRLKAQAPSTGRRTIPPTHT